MRAAEPAGAVRGGRAAPLSRVRAAIGGSRTVALLALVAYAALAAKVTWPWLIHPDSISWGTVSGDLGSHIATPSTWARAHVLPWLPGTVPQVDAPDGLSVQWALNLAAASSLTVLWLLNLVMSPIAANGLFVFSGFTLSAWSMFLLARRLTGHAGAALIAGLAFGFWPYAYATVSQPLGHGWVLVLLVWRMLGLIERPTLRNGVWAALATLLALTWIQYWLAIAGVLWGTLAVAGLVVAASRGQLRRAVGAHAVAAVAIVALAGVLFAAGRSTGFDGLPVRASADPVTFSARPLMYLLPSPGQPWLGSWSGPLIAQHFSGVGGRAAYNPIYVGISIVVLALVGMVAVGVRWRRDGLRDALRRPAVAGTLACAFAGLVALVMSAPPEVQIHGVVVPLPGKLLADRTTAFRTTARFAHVVMLALAVLAGHGVRALLRGRFSWPAVGLTAVLAFVVFSDLSPRDPIPLPVAPQRIVADLGRQPRGIVAEYPIRPATGESTGPLFDQVFHRQPIFNGYRAGSASETAKLGLSDLTSPGTVPALRALGVTYVLVRATSEQALPGIPDPGARVPGMRILTEDGFGTLYRITAPAARTLVLVRSGASYPEGPLGRRVRWLTARTSTLAVRSDCATCQGTLRFSSTSYIVPRRLTIRSRTGAVLARQTIPPDRTVTVRVPLRFSRTEIVSLTVSPGPVQASPTDTRTIGIQIGEPRFTPASGGAR